MDTPTVDNNSQNYLKVKINNFGPINEGEIKLKPFTIFIGPNNSGKSYAAMLIKSIINRRMSTAYKPEEMDFNQRRFWSRFGQYYGDNYPLMTKILHNISTEIEINRRSVKSIEKTIVETGIVEKILNNISYSFSARNGELIRYGAESFQLEITNGAGSLCIEQFRVKKKVNYNIKTNNKIKINQTFNSPTENSGAKIEKYGWSFDFNWKEPKEILEQDGSKSIDRARSMHDWIISILGDNLSETIFSDLFQNCIYLPAARSGIMQAQQILTNRIIETAPFAGIAPIDYPRFPGITADFLNLMSFAPSPDNRVELADIAKVYEDKIIHGTIKKYQFKKNRVNYFYSINDEILIPLHLASSTVSELAPLFEVIKKHLQPGNLLIIEEPETHLHPGNQLLLAGLLVRLINKGIRVLITTHSSYLMEQINNHILFNNLNNKENNELNYDINDALDYNKVAVYSFVQPNNKSGTKILPIQITSMDGISQDEFVKIYDVLYNDSIKLRKSIDKQMVND